MKFISIKTVRFTSLSSRFVAIPSNKQMVHEGTEVLRVRTDRDCFHSVTTAAIYIKAERGQWV